MPITLLCPNLLCRKPLQVRDDLRGQRVRCPHCEQVLRVPLGSGPAPPSAERKPGRR